MSNRLHDIERRLMFAWEQRKALSSLISRAKIEGSDVADVDQIAADVLSAIRECYDYCASDILDLDITPSISDTKVAARVASGKESFSFPFHANQFANPKPLMNELSSINGAMYAHLKSLAKAIQDDDVVPGMVDTFGCVVEAQQIINSKKHNRIQKVNTLIDTSSVIRLGDGYVEMSPIYKMGGDGRVDFSIIKNNDASCFVTHGDAQAITAHEYRFALNNKEIDRFCSSFLWVTKSIIQDFYHRFFGADQDSLRYVCSPTKHPRAVSKRALIQMAMVALHRYLAEVKAVEWVAGEDLQDTSVDIIRYNLRREQICKWLKDEEVWLECRPRERSFLQSKHPSSNTLTSVFYRTEALWALLWCMGLVDDMSFPAHPCDGSLIPHVMPIVGASTEIFVTRAKLRPEAELVSARSAVHQAYGALLEDLNSGTRQVDDIAGAVTRERGIAITWVFGEQDHWNDLP